MADATSGRGGVGIRLFTTGAEVVRRTFDQVGDSGRKMWAQIALGEKAANPAIRALSRGVGEAKDGINDLAGRAGSATSVLGAFGAGGVAAAAALGALAIALGQTREAMAYAADLTDTADRIGVGVEALQAWRYVADEAGVSTQTFQANLEKVNGVLGAFKLGIGDAKLKPIFEELGISKDQLDSIHTADELMLLLADTLGQIKDRASQVRLARGLGMEESLPILRMGSERIRELMLAAEDLGVVLDKDTVKRLDEADRKMELVGQQMKLLTFDAVAPLASWLANTATYVANLTTEFSHLEDKMPSIVQWMLALQRNMPGTGVVTRLTQMAIGRIAPKPNDGPGPNQDAGVDIPDDLSARLDALAEGSGGGGFDPRGHSSRGGGSGRSAADRAKQEAAQRLRREQQVEDANARADREIGRALTDDRTGTFSIEETAANDVVEIQRDLADRYREIDRQVREYAESNGLRGLTQVEADQLKAKQQALANSREAAVLAKEDHDLAAERLRNDERSAEAALDLMQVDAQLARTHSERVRVEREILLSSIAIARRRRDAEIDNDANLSDDEKRDARAEFDRGAQGQIRLFDDQEVSRQREQFREYGREFTDALRDGNLGDYFASLADRFTDKLLDSALNGLFDSLFSGTGKGGGGWLSNIGSWAASLFTPGGGRASGGDARDGFVYRMAEHGPELALFGANGQVVNHADTVRMIQGLTSGGTGATGASGGDVIVDATYAPNIRVDGSGPEVEALRRELATERAQFRSNVVSAVREAKQRREV